MRSPSRSRRNNHGQDIVEFAGIGVLLVVLGLFFLDAGVVVMAQMTAGSLAKDMARAAANQVSETAADAVVTAKVTAFQATKNPFYTFSPKPPQPPFWNTGLNGGSCTVTVSFKVKLPFPLPFVNLPLIVVTDVEPIVGTS